MDFENWISKIIESGNLCSGYTDKVLNAQSKLQIMRTVLDANGCSWLPEMDKKGMPLPYSVILSEFKNYINGNYIAEFRNERGSGYSSTLYCCYSDSNRIDVTTTIITLLGCGGGIELHIAPNNFCHIYLDKNCDVKVFCPDNGRAIIDMWDGAKCSIHGNNDRVLINKL